MKGSIEEERRENRREEIRAQRREEIYRFGLINKGISPFFSFHPLSLSLSGHLEVLKWARENGCAWDSRVCANAAEGGQREISLLFSELLSPLSLSFVQTCLLSFVLSLPLPVPFFRSLFSLVSLLFPELLLSVLLSANEKS